MATLTEEQRKLILELAEDEELTKAEIARRAGVSRPTVYKVLREAGLLESVSDEEDDEETYADSDDNPDTGEEEDGETDEEPEEEDYAELTSDDPYDRGYHEGHREGREEGYKKGYEKKHGRKPLDWAALLSAGVVGGAALMYLMLRGFPNPPGPSSPGGAGPSPGPRGGPPRGPGIGR